MSLQDPRVSTHLPHDEGTCGKLCRRYGEILHKAGFPVSVDVQQEADAFLMSFRILISKKKEDV